MGAYDELLADIRADVAANDPAFAAALKRRGALMPPARHQRPDEMRAHADDDDEPRRYSTRAMPPPTGAERARRAVNELSKAMSAIKPLPPTPAQQIAAARATVDATMAKALAAFRAGAISAHDVQRLELVGTNAIEQIAARLAAA